MEHPVIFSLDRLPLVNAVGAVTAREPFLHQDRIFACHVLICVHRGEMEVVEDGVPYLVKEGQCLLLRAGVHHWGKTWIQAGTS
jgi:hypothetical protein